MSDRNRGTLQHDLRGALSAVQVSLQTLETLEATGADLAPEKRIAIVRRAMAALAEAVELADGLREERPNSAADPN